MLWIRVWHWWYELVAVPVILLAGLIIYLTMPSGYQWDTTGLILIGGVVVAILGLLTSSYVKYRQQVGTGK